MDVRATFRPWAASHGRISPNSSAASEFETLGRLLAEVNAPDEPMSSGNAALYYGFLQFGSGDDLPGAELNGRWYTRNALIFAKLMQVAQPGDRIVLIFGAGHAYWLRHFASTTPGYMLVEPNDYLTGR